MMNGFEWGILGICGVLIVSLMNLGTLSRRLACWRLGGNDGQGAEEKRA